MFRRIIGLVLVGQLALLIFGIGIMMPWLKVGCEKFSI